MSAVQLTIADRCEIASNARPGSVIADSSSASFTTCVDRLTVEDRYEILANARLVSWNKPVLGGRVELYPPVFVPGQRDENGEYSPVPKYWRKKFARDRISRLQRNTVLARAPHWTGEPRPRECKTVELLRPDITEKMLIRFASHWLTRNLRWTLEGNHDADNPLTYTATRPPAERLARGENYADESVVTAFLREQPSIRKLLCYERGEEIVSELQRVLTYGATVEASAEKLASFGITQAAFEKRVQRLRHDMEEQMELPYGKKVIDGLMADAPEGTKDVLERASKRAGRKVGELWRKLASPTNGDRPVPKFQEHPFEAYFDRADNPVKYLGEQNVEK